MKNLLLFTLVIASLTACSDKRESDIDHNFRPGSVAEATLKAIPSSQVTPENTSFNANVPFVGNNSQNPFAFTIVNQPVHGTVSMDVHTGAYSYAPYPNYSGPDLFTWQVTQGNQVVTSTVTITVVPANLPPVANPETFVGNEDTPITGTVTGSDPNNDPLTFILVGVPTHGTLIFNSDGTFQYTPSLNYNGSDTFTFRVNDGTFNSNIATVTLTVNPVNDAPVAQNSSFTIPEDSTLTNAVHAVDVDSGTLTYAVVANPLHGTVSLNSTTGSFVYTPTSNYNGPDSFTFKANDGQLDSNVATVSINITPVNDAPTALPLSFTTNEDTSYSGTLTGVDPEGNTLTYSIVSNPTKGTVVINNANLGTFTYVPNANVNGSDSFTFKVNDGTSDSNVATVSITIVPINDPPVAYNAAYSLAAGASHSGVAQATDIDSGTLTFILLTNPTQGTITFNSNGSFTYVANNNASGVDTITFKANDGQLDSNVATITFNINASNQPPVAQNLSFTLLEDQSLTNQLVATDPENNTLSYNLVGNPQHGSLTVNSNGSFTYTPVANYNGSDSFTYKANDGQVDSNVATVSITVSPVNDAPVAVGNSYTINEDQILNGVLQASDVDGDTLTYILVTNPLHGAVSLSGSNFVYTPTLNYNGSDSFTFKVNDGTVDSNIATINITINAQNDPPVVSNLNLTTPEDTPISTNFIFSDVDGPAIGPWTITVAPTKGTVNITNPTTGAFTYTPNANQNGTDSFKVKLSDTLNDSNEATITINIIPVNDAPVAYNDSFAVNPGQSYSGNLQATDVDGDPLTYILVTSPTKGSISVNPTTGAFTYSANINSTGTDSFTFKVNDGNLNSNIATISVNLNLLNIAPVASSQAFSINEDTVLNAQLQALDINGDTLTYSAVTNPLHGTVTVNSTTGAFVYTPALNYNGPDSFTFKANDGQLDSNIATINITVIPVNDAPVAIGQSLSVQAGSTVTGQASATDIDGDSLIYILQNGAVTKGTLTFNSNGSFTYTANVEASGTDSFTFKANDGQLDSNIATITININGVNQPPVAQNQSLSTPEDTPISGTLIATDVNSGDTLTYSIVSNPVNGTVTVNSATGAFTYTPSSNYNGTDSFMFKANDGQSNSNIATVSIQVSPVNDAPTANPLAFTTNEDVPYSGNLTASDVDGNSLTYYVVANPGHGTVTVNSVTGAFTYTPSSNYHGADNFTFKVNDGTVDSNVATVSITVVPVNDAPVANNLSFSTNEDVPYSGNLTASDIDGDPLTYSLVMAPSKGTVSVASNGSFTYTPNANATGSDSFTFKVNDGTVDSNIATVSISIISANDIPVAYNQSLMGLEDTPLNITLTATDADNDPLTYSIVAGPSHGTLSGSGANIVYTPSSNYYGSDSFTFKANDGQADSNIATISINLGPVNDIPVANNLSISTNQNVAVSNHVTATDADGDVLTYQVVSNVSHGTLVFNTSSGNFTYTPNNNYVGSDSFTFIANDGQSNSNLGTVSINVISTNQPPVAFSNSYNVTEDTPYGGNMQAQDPEGQPLTYTVLTTVTHGTLTYNSTNGTFTYTPSSNYNGSDSFTFKVNDGQLDSNIATISLTVQPVNDIPVAYPQSISVSKNSTNNPIVLVGSDVETSSLNYIIVANPGHGTLSGSGANRTYTPTTGYSGADSFTFKVNDGTADSNVATVSITVIDDTPPPPPGWCDVNSPYTNKLVLNNQDQSTALTNFPVMIKLNSSRVNYADLKSHGEDLRFYDANCNLIPHEIERWDTAGNSFVWVKVPQIDAMSNASFIWMFYGNPAAVDMQNPAGVWGDNYKGVYHLSETSGNIVDSAQGHNLTKQGSISQNTAGKIAGGDLFNSGNQLYKESTESADFRITNYLTLESWVYLTSCDSNDVVVDKLYNQSSCNNMQDYSLTMNSCKPKLQVGSKYIQLDSSLSLNQWVHVVGTFNQSSNTCKLYINGVLKKTSTGCSSDLSGLGGHPLTIGNNDSTSQYLHGAIDEVRVSKAERSADYIRAQHLSMTDGMVSYGSRRQMGDSWHHILMTIKENKDDGKIMTYTNTLYQSGYNGIIYQGATGSKPVWGYYRFKLPESIPAGATIKKASIRLYGRDVQGSWTNQYLVVYLQNSANASQISNANQAPGLSGGTTTVATSEGWNAPSFNNWKVDDWNDSPNIKNVVTDLKTTQGLTNNNYIQVWITRSNPNNGIVTEIGSEDNSYETINHAQLMIEWQ